MLLVPLMTLNSFNSVSSGKCSSPPQQFPPPPLFLHSLFYELWTRSDAVPGSGDGLRLAVTARGRCGRVGVVDG